MHILIHLINYNDRNDRKNKQQHRIKNKRKMKNITRKVLKEFKTEKNLRLRI